MYTQYRTPEELDEWLVKMGWGLFLLGLGAIWLFDNLMPRSLDGLPELWGGFLLLALNGMRFLLKLRMSGFTLGVGAILVFVGLGNLANLDIPFVPVLFIIIGAGMVLRAILSPGLFKRSNKDYTVGDTAHPG